MIAFTVRACGFNINDVPILPLPTFRYPLGSKRKPGLLIPSVGVDNVFGFTYRQGFFWPITPSQDLTVTPLILSKRGGGSDFEYRYIINRQSRGNWLLSTLYDTDQGRGRADVNGAHVQEFSPDLSLKLKVNYSTDRSFLQDLSNSGVLRALPSQESLININQRLPYGKRVFTRSISSAFVCGRSHDIFNVFLKLDFYFPIILCLEVQLRSGWTQHLFIFFENEGFRLAV